MEFIKLLGYVEKSFLDKPSFLILMSDGKEYISNGCVFKENNEANIKALIEEHECEVFIKELLASNEIDMSSVTNARYMFCGTQLTSFNSDMSSVTNARYMFYGTQLTSFNSDMSSVTNAYCMFEGTPIADKN